MKRICVYCGSNPGFDPAYMETARNLGCALVERKLGLVYGGADVGLMGELADTVINGGGEVIGIIPKIFANKIAHPRLTELRVVNSMHERKKMMFDISDGFIALPGGLGTLDEIAELLTWAQIGFNKKPCGFLNINGYYDMLLSFLDNMVSQGFMKSEHRDMIIVADNSEEMLNRFATYNAPTIDKWIKEKPKP